MLNFDCLTLKAFFDENIDFFIGARLQKIQQPTRRDFVFLCAITEKAENFTLIFIRKCIIPALWQW